MTDRRRIWKLEPCAVCGAATGQLCRRPNGTPFKSTTHWLSAQAPDALESNPMNIEKAQSQLAAYGYTLTDSLQIQKGDKTFSVVVSAKGPRFYVKQMSGAALWSGPDLGDFVKSFWYAKKIEQPMKTNGRGIYHETPAGKHDMVLHQDHRGSWRIDLVTSAGGNHLDVTGPNRGYGSAEEAFQAALDVQRTRGIRGKSHVYIADRDGNLSDYEPMEANGRNDGTQEDDYVMAILDRDANIGLYRIVRGGKWMGPLEKSANVDTIEHAMEQDALARGVHAAAVFQSDGEGTTQVGNVINGRYQESGGYRGNGRMDPRTGARVPDPKFSPGDRVVRDDGSAPGEIAIVGNYDETIGGYRYKVQQDSGARIWWNESSTRRLFGCACEDGSTCDISHDPADCGCRQCMTAEAKAAYQGNGRSSLSAKARQDLEASYYYNERKIADAEEELRRSGISAEYRQQLRDMIASAKSDMEYAGGRMQTNGRATVVDADAARELDLYIANTYELVGAPNSIGKSIDANLKRKLASGKYDSALAPKAWQHLVDEGAKRYQKEFGSGSPIFNAATRRQVAADFARAWEEENGMRANGSPLRDGEKLIGKAISHDGRVLATFSGSAIRPLIARIDAAHPNSWGASISGEYTSDGTHHGPGKGRVVASREPRTVDGRFYSGWIIE